MSDNDWTEKPGRYVMGQDVSKAILDEAPEFRAAREHTPEELYSYKLLSEASQVMWAGAEVTVSSEPANNSTSANYGGTSLRSGLLQDAEDVITGDRNNSYGDPHQDFARTASILTAMGFVFLDPEEVFDIQAHHVAMILAAVKLSRLAWDPGKRDSWLDLAGYAACGYEAHELTKDTE